MLPFTPPMPHLLHAPFTLLASMETCVEREVQVVMVLRVQKVMMTKQNVIQLSPKLIEYLGGGGGVVRIYS